MSDRVTINDMLRADAYRAKAEALDALGRAVVTRVETAGALLREAIEGAARGPIERAWARAQSEFDDIAGDYYAAHLQVQEFVK